MAARGREYGPRDRKLSKLNKRFERRFYLLQVLAVIVKRGLIMLSVKVALRGIHTVLLKGHTVLPR